MARAAFIKSFVRCMKRNRALAGTEVWVLFRYTDDKQENGEVHGVYSSAEKAEEAADEWIGRDCSVTNDQLSIDSWVIDE